MTDPFRPSASTDYPSEFDPFPEDVPPLQQIYEIDPTDDETPIPPEVTHVA